MRKPGVSFKRGTRPSVPPKNTSTSPCRHVTSSRSSICDHLRRARLVADEPYNTCIACNADVVDRRCKMRQTHAISTLTPEQGKTHNVKAGQRRGGGDIQLDKAKTDAR